MKKIKLTKDNQTQVINNTIKILKKGGLVVFPSDTVYGAMVDATNDAAVKKLFKFKSRPPGRSISVFVSNFKMVGRLVETNQDQIKNLKEIFPGPFTVILQSKHRTSKLLESEKGTLGIRYPIYSLIEKLASRFHKPITATSANLSGYPPHYSVEALLKRLPLEKQQLIDCIIDVGKLPKNKPSTVIDLTMPKIKILRYGEIILNDQNKFFSHSPQQTKKIAQYLVEKLVYKKLLKPLILIIEGELGVGKTVFVKGVAENFGINNIISPSYVVYYEYATFNQLINNLIHFDLFNIEEKEEFKFLGIDQYLKPGNLLCFEWGEKAGEIINLLKSKGKVVYIKMKYINEREREIIINH